ncbi:MAG: phosphotransferase enzyme family protein [Jatrophihabitantaceae bacterium]
MRQQIDDGPLAGGTANRGRVIRIGDTVHRPVGAHTPAVHALLRHLAGRGFTAVPRVIGVNERAEIVGYLEGTAATDPVPAWALTDDALVSVGALLRGYHAACAGFDASRWSWQRPVPAQWQGPIVTHNDLNPANVIFRGGRAAALIDFDLAAPGAAAFDLAVTACFWAPLRADADIEDSRRGSAIARFRLLLDGYGAEVELRREVVAATGAANRWIADVIEENANRGHPAFGRLWQDAMGLHRRASGWLSAHTDDLLRASR